MSGGVRWYDRQGQPIDMAKASELMCNFAYTSVAQTEESGYRVSTVWLGLNHRFMSEGPPVIFETMIFGPDDWSGEYCERHATEAAALAGHDQAVMHLRHKILPQVNS